MAGPRKFAFMAMNDAAKVLSGYNLAFALDEGRQSMLIATMAPDRQVLSFLKHCAQAQNPKCIVNDMLVQLHTRKIARLGSGLYITPTVTSEELRVQRYNQRIIATAGGEHDLCVDWCSMLDDKNKKNTESANLAKIVGHLIGLSAVPKND